MMTNTHYDKNMEAVQGLNIICAPEEKGHAKPSHWRQVEEEGLMLSSYDNCYFNTIRKNGMHVYHYMLLPRKTSRYCGKN